MKVLSSSQIRTADQHTIKNEPISSIDLMERASNAFVSKFLLLCPARQPVHIFCGTGNNGGDGLAVGRLLTSEGWTVSMYVLGEPESGSPDFRENLKRIENPKRIASRSDFPTVDSASVIIDALFGSGLSRPIDGLVAEMVQYLNSREAKRISIDIASGLYADQALPKDAEVFRPDHTISFQSPKLVFFQPDSYPFVGEWEVVDIGLDYGFLDGLKTSSFFTQCPEMAELVPFRSTYSHKGKNGRLLLIAGSKGKMGAAALSARAALRSGVGLITLHVPACGTQIIQTLVPEAMVIEDQADEYIANLDNTESTVGVGPGLGTHEATEEALGKFLKSHNDPIVLDADALNILARSPELIQDLPPQSILTPHPGEFKRLVGDWSNDFEKLDLLRSFCQKHQVNMVLKGAYSAVCNTDGDVHFNSTGNPGMATAGSGDVLTGIVSSFLAQGLKPFDALRLGVFVHGLSGDLAVQEVDEISLIASDIISNISNAIQKMCVSDTFKM